MRDLMDRLAQRADLDDEAAHGRGCRKVQVARDARRFATLMPVNVTLAAHFHTNAARCGIVEPLNGRLRVVTRLCYSTGMWDDVRWDDWNIAHIARRGVTEDEVDDVLLDPDSLRLRSRAGTYVVLGVTAGRRHLFVAVAPGPDGQVYPITARTMATSDRRRWERR